MIGQTKYTFFSLERAWENKERNTLMLQSLNLCIEILNDLIIDKIKEIKQLQNNIKLDTLEYAAKREKY